MTQPLQAGDLPYPSGTSVAWTQCSAAPPRISIAVAGLSSKPAAPSLIAEIRTSSSTMNMGAGKALMISRKKSLSMVAGMFGIRSCTKSIVSAENELA
jgi:hypothetical protein